LRHVVAQASVSTSSGAPTSREFALEKNRYILSSSGKPPDLYTVITVSHTKETSGDVT